MAPETGSPQTAHTTTLTRLSSYNCRSVKNTPTFRPVSGAIGGTFWRRDSKVGAECSEIPAESLLAISTTRRLEPPRPVAGSGNSNGWDRSHDLGQWCIFEIAQAGTLFVMWQEEVPQSLRASLLL